MTICCFLNYTLLVVKRTAPEVIDRRTTNRAKWINIKNIQSSYEL